MPEPTKRRSAFFLIRPRTAMLGKAIASPTKPSAANAFEVECAVATREPCLAECFAEPRLALEARRNPRDDCAAHRRSMSPAGQGRQDNGVSGYDKIAQA